MPSRRFGGVAGRQPGVRTHSGKHRDHAKNIDSALRAAARAKGARGKPDKISPGRLGLSR